MSIIEGQSRNNGNNRNENRNGISRNRNSDGENTIRNSEYERFGWTNFFVILLAIAISSAQKDITQGKGTILVISLLYFILCGVFDFLWMKFYLIDVRENKAEHDRDWFHVIVHKILPGAILLMGYVFLIQGFQSDTFQETQGHHIILYAQILYQKYHQYSNHLNVIRVHQLMVLL